MWLSGEESACQWGDTEDLGSIPGWEDPLEEEMATNSSIFSQEILWTEESGGLYHKELDITKWLSIHATQLQWSFCIFGFHVHKFKHQQIEKFFKNSRKRQETKLEFAVRWQLFTQHLQCVRYCRSPRDNLKSVEGRRYYVILHKGLEHLWIGVSPGVLEPMPWGSRRTTAFCYTDHPCVGPPPVTCLDFLFRICCPGGHTASLEGRMEHLLELVSTSAWTSQRPTGKTVPATGPSATG